ncbi:hypothetical protein B0H12DRAFT_1081501 [Mycena haematopus]|nr:hypothetical protein B0H12DRAFT_1081501 [Mycena haematopus]
MSRIRWSSHRHSPLRVGSQRLRTVGEINFRICSGILKTAKIESRVVIPSTLTAEGGLTAAADSGRNQFSNLQRNIETAKIESWVVIPSTLTAEGGLTAAADTKIESRVVIPSTLTAEGGLTAAANTKIESRRLRTVGEINFRICSRILKTAKIESSVVIPSTPTTEGGLTAAEETKIESRVVIPSTLTTEAKIESRWSSHRHSPLRVGSQRLRTVGEINFRICSRILKTAKIESRVVIPSTLTAERKIESSNGWSAHRDSPLRVGSQRLRTVGEINFRICSGILKTAKIESRVVIPSTLTAEGGLTAAANSVIPSTLTAEGGLTAAANTKIESAAAEQWAKSIFGFAAGILKTAKIESRSGGHPIDTHPLKVVIPSTLTAEGGLTAAANSGEINFRICSRILKTAKIESSVVIPSTPTTEGGLTAAEDSRRNQFSNL